MVLHFDIETSRLSLSEIIIHVILANLNKEGVGRRGQQGHLVGAPCDLRQLKDHNSL